MTAVPDKTMADLVEQVGRLETETTNLLEAVGGTKADLDVAIDQAEEFAEAAESAKVAAEASEVEALRLSNAAKADAGRALVSANESKAAKEAAEAIVYDGEASEVAGLGKIPVGGSSGLDKTWVPLLHAMYPHSGVIGSVDKKDLFLFNQSSSQYSNIFTLQGEGVGSQIRFNIAGRLVAPKATSIVLQEAESTPERAIAFDDIFLDWDGNVTPYRSITPHRTTTGYDADAIATEHGYSKVSTGLYKIGDTYALLLGRVARRNKGAYHPVFNRDGAKGYANHETGDSNASSGRWYLNYIRPVADVVSVFTTHANGGSVTNKEISGSIEGDEVRNSRPDSEFYDAIYADDFTPLYFSAKNIVDRQALLFDSFNKAVSGETFMGAEGTPVFKNLVSTDYTETVSVLAGVSSTVKILTNSVEYTESQGDTRVGVVFYSRKTKRVEIKYDLSINKGSFAAIVRTITNSGSTNFYTAGESANGHNAHEFDVPPEVLEITHVFVRAKETSTGTLTNYSIIVDGYQVSARPQFLMVDIIGAKDAMPDEWFPDPDNYEATKDRHIPGNWLSRNIPAGESASYTSSWPVIEFHQALKTSDNGTTWIDITHELRDSFESSNSATMTLDSTDCVMLFYDAKANPFQFSDVLPMMSELRLIASDDEKIVSNLIGKVTAGSTTKHLAIPEYQIDKSGRLIDKSLRNIPQNFDGGTGVKSVVSFAKSDDGVVLIQMHTQEIKDEGDTTDISVVNSQSTVMDDFGEDIIVTTKIAETQYQWSN